MWVIYLIHSCFKSRNELSLCWTHFVVTPYMELVKVCTGGLKLLYLVPFDGSNKYLS